MGRAVAGGAADATKADDGGGVRLVSVSWNQDSTHFGVVTTADFRVFDCSSPFHEKLRRVLPHGAGDGYAMVGVEMVFRSEIFVLVAATAAGEGCGRRSRVVVWDDRENRRISDVLEFQSDVVRAVRVSKDYLAVVLDRAVRVYPLLRASARPIWRIATALNRRGLCCLSCHAGVDVLACLGTTRGQVRVDRLGNKPEARFIAAHSSHVACMAMTVDGAVLATASVKGTLVRVFSTMDGTCLQQVRRGLDPAEIHSIALSRDLQWLAVCSDKGTLHVFSLRARVGAKDAAGHKQSADQAARSVVKTNTASASNARSSLSFMKVILPDYFSSEWSFAQFRLPETTTYVTAFGEQQNTVMIIGMDSSFYRCRFDPVNGKEMVRKEYFQFLKDKDSPPFRARV
ncbi:hypothetical protein SORBI_3009G060000 [Sorghum bicolor]|uniref:Uncharacterized protein n=2 Tax=Sorghum bicolor TaxID=4558 RepID=A0A1B6P6T1_SORBI|nr:hypothetical protein SORBI_3009G060000 [Sorghum bicolor]